MTAARSRASSRRPGTAVVLQRRHSGFKIPGSGIEAPLRSGADVGRCLCQLATARARTSSRSSVLGPSIMNSTYLLFGLFAATLLGIARFHEQALPIAVGGLLGVLLVKLTLTQFDLAAHVHHEWMTIVTLLACCSASRCWRTTSRRAFSRTS